MLYYFKRKIQQIKNIIRWIPVLWNNFDWDYSYSLKVFKFQLENQAKYFESNKPYSMDAKQQASRIRLILRLMDKVYDDEYSLEEYNKIKGIYGKEMFEWILIPVEGKNGVSTLKYKYEFLEDKDKVKEMEKAISDSFIKGRLKHNRAHKLLWDLIEHNITRFWD